MKHLPQNIHHKFHRGEIIIVQQDLIPTVCLDVTSLVVCSYGCNNGRIGPPRCALIGAALGDRWSQCWACRISPSATCSARSALVGVSRQASTAAPGAFHRSKTILRSATIPCGDASPARCAPDTHPFPPPLCLV